MNTLSIILKRILPAALALAIHRVTGSRAFAWVAPVTATLSILAVSDRRVLGRLGRWNRANSPWVKAGLAVAVVAMSLGLLVTL